jgi:hypothetical protein
MRDLRCKSTRTSSRHILVFSPKWRCTNREIAKMNRNTTTLSWRPEFIYGIIQRAILIAAVGLLLTATPAVAQERAGVLERIGAFFGGTVEVEIEDGAVLVENLEVLVAAGEPTPG